MRRLIKLLDELVEAVGAAGRRPQAPRVAPWVAAGPGLRAGGPGPAPWVVEDHAVLEEASQAALRHDMGERGITSAGHGLVGPGLGF